jgi:AcrR family transcriptional regulator
MKKEKTEEKRQLIVTEASKCFSQFGFEKTTLDDIGKSANLNKATLYYYFKNKEEIFMEVVLQESTRFITELQAKTVLITGFEEKICSYLIERLRFYKQVVNLHQLSIVLLRQIQPIFDELYNNVLQTEIQFIKQILEVAATANQISFASNLQQNPQQNLQEIAESIISVANSLKHEAVLQSKTQFAHHIDYSSIEQKTIFITQLILNGLKK